MFLPFEPAGAAAIGFSTRSRNADAPQLVYDKLGLNNLAFYLQARCRDVTRRHQRGSMAACQG